MMEPTLSSAAPSAAVTPASSIADTARDPMWRYMLRLLRQVGWVFVLFLAFVMWVSVRLECQQLQKNLDLNRRETMSAKVQNQQLSLELESRRSIREVERGARENGLDQPARVVRPNSGALAAGAAVGAGLP